jgi:hypothetical protein
VQLSLSDFELLFYFGSSYSTSRLSFETRNLTGYLFYNVIKAYYLSVGILNTLTYRVHVLTEASDVSGLLDYNTPVVWLRGNDSSDLTLRDDGVTTRGEPHNSEELFDVFKTARNFIEEEL